ncbi:MAG: hypothetical protein J6U77_06855, partial [Verrucomicrobia bacterium]|nr:hypothetical protein [Verrucomicrobiota bacterium]
MNAIHWREREDKKIKMEQVRPAEIMVGESYIYRGVSTITRCADYNAVVRKITPYLVIMDICI